MAMAMVGSCGAAGSSASSTVGGGFLKRNKGRREDGPRRFVCSAASSTHPSYRGGLREQYRTLRIQPGASEKEVKKAFRKLALQYHPDVCKGSNCGVQFHRINEAYDLVMDSLRAAEAPQAQEGSEEGYVDDQMRGMYSRWDLWEEWMGWEGAGIRDYSSHINPYI